jgi:voltage-gated potassium channel
MSPDAIRRSGAPKSPANAAYLERFDARMRLPIVISAILPLIVVPESGGWFAALVGVVTWLVFLLDYVTHHRRIDHFGRTRYGRFDLFVVVATAPWFLLPGVQLVRFAVFLRLARLARLVMASRNSRRLFTNLGRVGLVAFGVVFVGSGVAYHAEKATNPEFATYGDALWWGIVTLTTVGYGDIVPKTSTGRWAGVAIMLTGIAVLGLLSGSLASFFRLAPSEPKAGDAEAGTGEQPADTMGSSSPPASLETTLAALTDEVSALRREVQRLSGTPPGSHR